MLGGHARGEAVSRGAGAAELPGARAADARALAARADVPALGGAAARGRERRERVRVLRRAAVRERAAALRPPADGLREGHRAALPDAARPARRAPLRLGLPRAPRRARGRE